MLSEKWFWILVTGALAGFAFAAGSDAEGVAKAKLQDLHQRDSTAGSNVVGARTDNTPGVF